MLTVKKYHYNYRWNFMIFSVQKICSPSVLLTTSLIFCQNHMLPIERLANLIANAQQVKSMFGTAYRCEQFFLQNKMLKVYAVFTIVKSKIV